MGDKATYKRLHGIGLSYNRHTRAWEGSGGTPVLPTIKSFAQFVRRQIKKLPFRLPAKTFRKSFIKTKKAEEESETYEEPEEQKVQVQEIHIYGIQNKRERDKREYGIFELALDVPANIKSQEIADFLEKQGIYNIFEANDSGKPNLNERRIKVAGMKTMRVEALGDWQQAIKDKIGHVRWKRDRQRGEKTVVVANKDGHQIHLKADEESAKGRM
jgi:hypothetical protein